MATVDTNHWIALKNRATETGDLLQQLLTHSQADDIPEATKAFSSYCDLWQQTASEAYNYGLHGLYDVCMLFYEAVFDLSEQQQCLDDNHGKLLEQWQELFLAYLGSPEMDSSRSNLIRHLQEPLWLKPLPDEDVEILKNLLLPETVEFSVNDSKVELVEPVESVQLENDKELPVADDSDPWTTLKNQTTQAAEMLQKSLLHSQVEDAAEFTAAFDGYVSQWQKIASKAYDYRLHGLYDVCMLFHEAVHDVSEQHQQLDAAHGKLLEQWQELFTAYLDSPELESSRTELIQLLQEPLWLNPLPDEDVEILINLLLPEAVDFRVEPDEELVESTEPVESVQLENDKESVVADDDSDPWTTLKNRATQAAEMLQKSLLHSQVEDTTKFTEAFDGYVSLWQKIASKAYDYGLHGLYDVCMLFHEAVLEVGEQHQQLDAAHEKLLEQWHELFMAYLDSPELESSRAELIQLLQEPLWTYPLPDDDANILKKLLLPEAVEFSVEIEDDQPSDVQEQLPEQLSEAEIETDFEQPPLDLNNTANVEETTVSATTITPDLVTLIQGEFKPFADSLVVALDSEPAKTLDPEQFNLAMDKQTDELEMLARVSQSIGMIGLQRVFDCLHENMDAMFSGKRVIKKSEPKLLKTALELILQYIEALDDDAAGVALVKHLKNPQWLKPLSESEADSLLALFKAVTVLSEEEAREPQKTATNEDVSLQIPEDVNQDLFETLLNELPTLTSDFTEAIQQVLRNGDMQDVEKAQRIAHTVKGSGNLVGIVGIATLTHHIEEILEKVAEHGSMPKRVFDSLLMDSADCLEAMSDSILGKGDAPDDALSILQQLMNWTYRISVEGIPDSAAEMDTTAESEEKPIDKAFDTRSKPRTGTETMTRVPSSLVEDMLRMAGETSILTGQIQQRLTQTIDQSKSAGDQNIWLLDLILELEHLVDVKGIASQNSSAKASDEFDPLEMDQYNELHTCSHRLMEIATDAREVASVVDTQLAGLKDLLLVQERLQKENHELVLRTRMVPVQTIVSRFQRAIRQACRVTGKKVKLNIIGADTLIDRDILNSLIDSVMHLLRNSADHGIESSEQRLAAKKPETGRITLEFARKGNRIVVVCQDDGAGLDLVKIRKTAEEKSLIEDDQALSDQELQRLILMPGFSTRSSATQVSGRGIGMDAVNAQVIKMKGELLLNSQFGEGCRIELLLPDTLVSIRAVLVRCGKQLVAVSNRGLEQILYPGAGKLQVMGDEQVYHLGEKIYAADKLETLLNIPGSDEPEAEGSLSALLIKMENGESKTIMVDHVMDSRELVVKNMGQYIPEISGIAGATILGDGSVTPVLDIPELLRNSLGQITTQMQSRSEQIDPSIKLPNALVIDDSLSARRSLAQLLKDTGLHVNTAIDGVDAIDKIDAKRPDIILVDLEMPRMNGIELTSYVRKRADLKNIPIIMVTSRATDKHRKQAESAGVNAYLTKPFSEDELMGHVNQSVGAIA